MPPAKSAAPGAWPILGRVRRASCPPAAALTPQSTPGGVRAAGESGSGEYAAFRVLLGVEGEEKGAPPAAAIQSGPPQCTAGIVPAEMQMRIFSLQMPMQMPCARPCAARWRRVRPPPARPPARWRVGSARVHRPARHPARGNGRHPGGRMVRPPRAGRQPRAPAAIGVPCSAHSAYACPPVICGFLEAHMRFFSRKNCGFS